MAELGDFMVPQDGEAEFTKDVTVDMLDYKYVEECTDAQKLKQVLAVLKSGKEGFYPQLIQATEEKLLVLLPVKERQQVMRMKAQVSPAEICEAESGLSAWQSKIVGTDKVLSSVSKLSGETKPVASKRLPPVRGSTSSSPPTSSNDSLSESSADEKAQLLRVAEREKQKGNESFRSGDLEEAVRCYCRSIDADSCNAIAYANRGMAYLKLEKLDKAEFDCSQSLKYDPTYVKAWSRRGLTRFKRGKYSDSASDFFHAIKLDPENKELPQLLQKAKDKHMEVEGQGEWMPPGQRPPGVADVKTASPAKAAVPSEARSVAGSVASASGRVAVPITHNVASKSDLLLPAAGASLLASGKYQTVSASSVAGGTTASSSAGAFTRVAITFDDDDEDEEDDEVAQVSTPQQQGETQEEEKGQESFTRVRIIEDDSSDEEDTTPATSAPTSAAAPKAAAGTSVTPQAAAAAKSTPTPTAPAAAPIPAPVDYTCTLPQLIQILGEFDRKLVAAPNDDAVRAERTRIAQLVREMEKNRATEGMPPAPPTVQKAAQAGAKAAAPAAVPAAVPAAKAAAAAPVAVKAAPAVPAAATTTAAPATRAPAAAPKEPTALPPPPAPTKPTPSPLAPLPTSVPATATPPVSATPATTPNPTPTPASASATATVSTADTKPKSSSQRAPTVPAEVPKTMYEFERIWRGLKDKPAAFAQYLETFQKKSEVKKVMKEAVSPDLVSSVFKALRDHGTPSSVSIILGGLSQAGHFGMMLRLMEDDDVQCIRTIFFNLLQDTSLTEEVKMSLQQLKETYKL